MDHAYTSILFLSLLIFLSLYLQEINNWDTCVFYAYADSLAWVLDTSSVNLSFSCVFVVVVYTALCDWRSTLTHFCVCFLTGS